MSGLVRYVGPVAIQAAGSCATFAIAVLLTRIVGIEAQGQFSFIKSWSDTVLTALLFGLPQSILHLAYNSDKTLSELYTFVLRYAERLIPASIMVGAVAWGLGLPWLTWVVISAPGLVLHGLVRSLLLRRCGPLTYAWVTVLPAISLLAAVAASVLLGIQEWGACILASALFSCTTCLWLASRLGLSRERGASRIGAEYASTNVHAFVQNITSAAQLAGLLSLASFLGASKSDIGELSLAFLAVQVFAVAAGFAAPAVYNAFEPSRGLRALLVEHKVLLWGTLLMSLLVVPASVLMMPLLLQGFFGVSSHSAIMACRIALVAGVLVLFNRFIATLLQRAGMFAILSMQGISRLFISFGIMGFMLHFTIDSTASEVGAVSILASELVLLAWLFYAIREFK